MALTPDAGGAITAAMTYPVTVSVNQAFNVPAERVFDAWLTRAVASRFLFATRTGNVMHCEMDPRVGGGFVVVDRRPNADGDESVLDIEHCGEFIEIDRPRRLVFDFSVNQFDDHPTRVTIDIRPTDTGCLLTLTHELGDSETAHDHEALTRLGWTSMLAQLERLVGSRRTLF